jgi:hypothetical protein
MLTCFREDSQMLSSLSRFRSQNISVRRVAVASAFTTLAIALACSDAASPTTPDLSLSRHLGRGIHVQYGAPTRVGNGRARTYVVTDHKRNDRTPLEIGIVLDERALEALPTTGMSMFDLALPAQNPTPYRLVELDWNSHGHEPDGVYSVPHFDFHFYTITAAERNAIDPVALGDSTYQAMANNLPPEAQRSQFYVPLSPPQGPIVAVPRMGAHWGDLRAPELQGAFGHPENFKPFTTTFLHGSWNGRFIFDEPMITRAFILSRKSANSEASRDSVISLSRAQQYRPAGYRPAAYRVAYDAREHEYRIALTQLTLRQ